jgi:hypothetical protein
VVPIPPFDEAGYLPPGIHDCSLEEVEERFGGFQGSDRRMRLFDKLRDYVRAVRSTGMGVALIIDGSFVTAKPDPNDIDLILLLTRGHDFTAQLRPFEYTAITKPGVRRTYRLDLFAFCEGTEEAERQLRFFQRVRGDEDLGEGILRIELRCFVTVNSFKTLK